MNVECRASRVRKGTGCVFVDGLYLQDASPAIGRGLEIGNAAAGHCLVTGKPTFACDTSILAARDHG